MGIEMDYNGYKPSREITVDEEFYDREQRRRRRWKDVVAYLGSSYQMDMSSLLYPKITSVSNNNEENLWLPNFQVNDLISSTTNPLLHSQITTVLELYEYISSDNYFDPAQKVCS